MSYDSADFRVQQMIGPIHASFASILTTGASVETATSVAADHIEFFRNVKVLGSKFFTRASAASGGAALSDHTPYYKILSNSSTDAVTSCAAATVAGVGTSGSVGSGTLAEVTSNEELSIVYKITGDGTDATHAAHGCDAYLLFEHRFA